MKVQTINFTKVTSFLHEFLSTYHPLHELLECDTSSHEVAESLVLFLLFMIERTKTVENPKTDFRFISGFTVSWQLKENGSVFDVKPSDVEGEEIWNPLALKESPAIQLILPEILRIFQIQTTFASQQDFDGKEDVLKAIAAGEKILHSYQDNSVLDDFLSFLDEKKSFEEENEKQTSEEAEQIKVKSIRELKRKVKFVCTNLQQNIRSYFKECDIFKFGMILLANNTISVHKKTNAEIADTENVTDDVFEGDCFPLVEYFSKILKNNQMLDQTIPFKKWNNSLVQNSRIMPINVKTNPVEEIVKTNKVHHFLSCVKNPLINKFNVSILHKQKSSSNSNLFFDSFFVFKPHLKTSKEKFIVNDYFMNIDKLLKRKLDTLLKKELDNIPQEELKNFSPSQLETLKITKRKKLQQENNDSAPNQNLIELSSFLKEMKSNPNMNFFGFLDIHLNSGGNATASPAPVKFSLSKTSTCNMFDSKERLLREQVIGFWEDEFTKKVKSVNKLESTRESLFSLSDLGNKEATEEKEAARMQLPNIPIQPKKKVNNPLKNDTIQEMEVILPVKMDAQEESLSELQKKTEGMRNLAEKQEILTNSNTRIEENDENEKENEISKLAHQITVELAKKEEQERLRKQKEEQERKKREEEDKKRRLEEEKSLKKREDEERRKKEEEAKERAKKIEFFLKSKREEQQNELQKLSDHMKQCVNSQRQIFEREAQERERLRLEEEEKIKKQKEEDEKNKKKLLEQAKSTPILHSFFNSVEEKKLLLEIVKKLQQKQRDAEIEAKKQQILQQKELEAKQKLEAALQLQQFWREKEKLLQIRVSQALSSFALDKLTAQQKFEETKVLISKIQALSNLERRNAFFEVNQSLRDEVLQLQMFVRRKIDDSQASLDSSNSERVPFASFSSIKKQQKNEVFQFPPKIEKKPRSQSLFASKSPLRDLDASQNSESSKKDEEKALNEFLKESRDNDTSPLKWIFDPENVQPEEDSTPLAENEKDILTPGESDQKEPEEDFTLEMTFLNKSNQNEQKIEEVEQKPVLQTPKKLPPPLPSTPPSRMPPPLPTVPPGQISSKIQTQKQTEEDILNRITVFEEVLDIDKQTPTKKESSLDILDLPTPILQLLEPETHEKQFFEQIFDNFFPNSTVLEDILKENVKDEYAVNLCKINCVLDIWIILGDCLRGEVKNKKKKAENLIPAAEVFSNLEEISENCRVFPPKKGIQEDCSDYFHSRMIVICSVNNSRMKDMKNFEAILGKFSETHTKKTEIQAKRPNSGEEGEKFLNLKQISVLEASLGVICKHPQIYANKVPLDTFFSLLSEYITQITSESSKSISFSTFHQRMQIVLIALRDLICYASPDRLSHISKLLPIIDCAKMIESFKFDNFTDQLVPFEGIVDIFFLGFLFGSVSHFDITGIRLGIFDDSFINRLLSEIVEFWKIIPETKTGRELEDTQLFLEEGIHYIVAFVVFCDIVSPRISRPEVKGSFLSMFGNILPTLSRFSGNSTSLNFDDEIFVGEIKSRKTLKLFETILKEFDLKNKDLKRILTNLVAGPQNLLQQAFLKVGNWVFGTNSKPSTSNIAKQHQKQFGTPKKQSMFVSSSSPKKDEKGTRIIVSQTKTLFDRVGLAQRLQDS